MKEKNLILTVAAVAAVAAIFTTAVVVAGLGNQQQTIAQKSGDGTTTAKSSAGQMNYLQGVLTSAPDPLPGHNMHQLAMILPPRDDGKIYTGMLTFTASKKVEVVVLHAFPKATIDGIDANKFGGLLSAPFTNKTTVAISLITPNYGSTPATSYSIPFSGNAIALHTLSGEQFATAYSVSYQLGTPTSGNTSTGK